jgi:hypothetical protein
MQAWATSRSPVARPMSRYTARGGVLYLCPHRHPAKSEPAKLGNWDLRLVTRPPTSRPLRTHDNRCQSYADHVDNQAPLNQWRHTLRGNPTLVVHILEWLMHASDMVQLT